TEAGRSLGVEKDGWTKGDIGIEKEDGYHKPARPEAPKGVDERTMSGQRP
ncbi:hypothetical protein A2U01_0049938, partial [Trifolium medium]|nr:hypothetical protein [Trifolium medium]